MLARRLAPLSVSVVLLCCAGFGPFPATLSAAPPPQVVDATSRYGLPDGYSIHDHGEWRWGAESSSAQPSERLVRFIDESFTSIRAQLRVREPAKTLFVQAESREQFDRVVRGFGARAPASFALAVALPERSLIVLDAQALRYQPLESYGETIAHEIVHVILGGAGRTIPRWYHEGIAQLLSGSRLSPKDLSVLALLSLEEGLIPFSEMVGFPRQHRMSSIYYRQSLCFCRYLSDTYGADVHARIVQRCASIREFDRAFRETVGAELSVVEQAWFRDVQQYFSWGRVLWQSIGLFHVLGVLLIFGFFMERRRRRRRLQQMAQEEAHEEAYWLEPDPRQYPDN